MSALLGRMPSAVGYQPTLASEMAALQERITSTKKGSITSVQAVYVPADDITDPAPATTFSHLDANIVLERRIAECPPAHCLYFNPSSLIGLLARHGLELLRRRLAFKPGIKLFLQKHA